jgi:thiosulfate/3-mercaptopyruvate sulfurtransferase
MPGTAHTTLIAPPALARHLRDPDWAIVDCRFALTETDRGRRDHEQGHIPGAIYAHLDDDLSGPVVAGRTGRHPLPAMDRLCATLSAWGIDARVQVIAYDDAGGAFAARLWWLLRWMGHDAVAVLDGGWPHWSAEQRPTRHGTESRPARTFVPHVRPALVVDASTVEADRQDTRCKLFDSRAADRYRGENETIDPVAGHIPGAVSAPFADNLDAEGRFQSHSALRSRFRALLSDTPADRATFYCGSGVTAAHNVLALTHAGLGGARLYAGSWSEWITDPRRPVAR